MRRGKLIGGAACILAAMALSPAGASAQPEVAGCGVFPDFAGAAGDPSADDQSAWNQDVSNTPRDSRSRRYTRRIRALGGNQRLHPDFGSFAGYGIPFTVVPQDEPLVPVTIGAEGYPDESDFGAGTGGPTSAPVPLDAPIEGGSGSTGDRHVLVVREEECDLWEMYRGFPDGPGWTADATALWDLGSTAIRPEGFTSTDAAGLPVMAGLVRYDEVAAGAVEHAIRVTFGTTRRGYIHPATHYASSACGRNLPPMGLRLRLKRGYYEEHISDFPADEQARPIFEALYRYGLIVADNGSNWFFTGGSSPLWDDDELSRLKDVPGGAFVVVDAEDGVSTPC